MTEPLTIGQRIVAKWEGPASDWSEPADLAEAIDAAIAAEREACASLADVHGQRHASFGKDYYDAASAAWHIRDAIRARSTDSNGGPSLDERQKQRDGDGD
jgi:hypothetical protein